MTIAVDFDGTIVEHKYPAIGKEIPGAVSVLKRLQAEGHRLILWTVREGDLLEEAIKYCKSRGLQFYAVNSDKPEGWNANTTRKLRADVFVDDSNLGGIPDWGQIYYMIQNRKTWGDIIAESLLSGDESRKRKKKGPFAELISRCREARCNIGPERHYESRTRHHW